MFDFSGDALCLDFVNTLGDRPRGAEERLKGPADLVAWAGQAGIVSRREAGDLSVWIERHPRRAARAFADAIELRECLYRVFSAGTSGDHAAPADLALLNDLVGPSLAHLRLAATEHGYDWGWTGGDPSLDRLLWPVVRSAADLLVSPEGRQVRECASDVCSWLFVDRSRTGRRRWCSMRTCGNRAKARRFYERRHAP